MHHWGNVFYARYQRNRLNTRSVMINASKALDEKAPHFYYGDCSEPDRGKIRSTAEKTNHVFGLSLFNPKWIQSVKHRDIGRLRRNMKSSRNSPWMLKACSKVQMKKSKSNITEKNK